MFTYPVRIESKDNIFLTVDGRWSDWEEWGPCTKSCGGGEQRRTRGCTNPPPANGGRNCIGEQKQTQACNQNACPGELLEYLFSFQIATHVFKCYFGKYGFVLRQYFHPLTYWQIKY